MIEFRCQNNILCAVGAHVDGLYRLQCEARPGLSVPSTRALSIGGCAFNVAAGLSRLGNRVSHAGLRGRDSDGDAVVRSLARWGIADVGIELPGETTGHYAALIQPDGSLALATAAMGIYMHAERLLHHEAFRRAAEAADAMVLDANAPPGANVALAAARGENTRLALLATSADKATSLEPLLPEAAIVFANESEWSALSGRDRAVLAIVTRGARGVSVREHGRMVAEFAAPPATVVDVVGAGDALCVGTLDAWLRGAPIRDAVAWGATLAARCVSHVGALGWLEATDGARGLDP